MENRFRSSSNGSALGGSMKGGEGSGKDMANGGKVTPSENMVHLQSILKMGLAINGNKNNNDNTSSKSIEKTGSKSEKIFADTHESLASQNPLHAALTKVSLPPPFEENNLSGLTNNTFIPPKAKNAISFHKIFGMKNNNNKE